MDNFNKSELDFFITALKEEARDVLWQVGSDGDPQILVDSCIEDLQALAPKENDERPETEVWQQIRDRLLKAAYATRPYCIRCGTCCTKGSPVLTEDDIPLLNRNIIRPDQVITIRKGEDTYSSKSESVQPSDREYIKIKEDPNSHTCVFFDKKSKECSIYETRPEQCRQQECWDPSKMSTELNYLDRLSILKEAGPVLDIIKQHEDKCSHDELKKAVNQLGTTHGETVQELLELLRYDHYVRQWVMDNYKLDKETLSFFFGRPLKDTLFLYGLKLEQEADGCFMLMPTEQSPSD
jgi:Fe-S-cluster containining protein